MHADYMDILRRIHQVPVWWDMNGCPRFDQFRPEDSPNIYAEECVLLRVACPYCGAEFNVEMNNGMWGGRRVLEALVKEGELAYSSPPRHDCEGDAMQSRAIRVVEFWRRDELQIWSRARWLEHTITGREVVG